MSQAGDKLFKMLAFQYKPLEKQLFKWCQDNKQSKILKKYKEGSSEFKIKILDRVAQELGY